jgi:hypothetical protein
MTDAPPKNSFEDLAGRRWLLKLNYGLAERIKDALGVDLANAHDGQAFVTLGRDPKLFIQTLAMLVEDQLKAAGVEVEQLVEQLDDCVLELAGDALAEMILLFTRPAIRPVIAEMLAKGREGREAAINLATDKLRSPATQAAIDRELARMAENIDAALAGETLPGRQSTPGSSATSSPRSPA